MSAKVIHVDFRARKVITRMAAKAVGDPPTAADYLQAIIDAVSVPVPVVEAPRPNFLEPVHHVYGCKYLETKDVPVKDLAKVVRSYCRDTYPLMKFSVRSGFNTLDVSVTDPGPVAVYTPNRVGYSDTMREILVDIEAFANQFNYERSDAITDHYQTKMYITTAVHYSAG